MDSKWKADDKARPAEAFLAGAQDGSVEDQPTMRYVFNLCPSLSSFAGGSPAMYVANPSRVD